MTYKMLRKRERLWQNVMKSQEEIFFELIVFKKMLKKGIFLFFFLEKKGGMEGN